MNSPNDPWKHFQQFFFEFPELSFHLDLSRMFLEENVFASIEPRWRTAWEEMRALEAGAVANPDEKRMVGHYWLRDPDLAPTREVKREIVETLASVKQFASAVHRGEITGARGAFTKILLVGIGGSCLGPQFVSDALGHPLTDKLDLFFLDNTDPDGMDRTLSRLVTTLGETLCVVVSKSGATKETRNGMVEVANAYERANLIFAEHAVAVTGRGSQLDLMAANWLARFPMWDWVGGRTSELSAVGLLPAALQGLDIDSILAGAKAMDHVSRAPTLPDNPAGLLALAWLHSGNDNVPKNMVILPYKDRLVLFSRYLQQLVMESLGKEFDRDGKKVQQGITVYGNKGSTDQHAYVQQLRDGPDDFFVTFIEVERDRSVDPVLVEGEFNSGDYLHGFLHGTRNALSEKGRKSILIGLTEVTSFSIGMLIALFERAVGYYAYFQNINAYHQPGVEAGKKAAEQILQLQLKVKQLLREGGKSFSADAIARQLPGTDVEEVYWICRRLAAQKILRMESGPDRFAASFSHL